MLCAGAVVFLPPAARASDSQFDFAAITRTLRKVFCHQQPHYEYDRRMIRASEIAVTRAHPQKTWRCWRYVKDALLDAGVVSKRPQSPWAKEAGNELCARFGFQKLPVQNPYEAPVGAVIVYGGPDAGHVELRTESGFVSDFVSPTPYPRPLIGVFVKAT